MFTDAIQFAGWLIQFSEMKIKKKKRIGRAGHFQK